MYAFLFLGGVDSWGNDFPVVMQYASWIISALSYVADGKLYAE